MAAKAPVLESVRAAIVFARASVPRVAGVLGVVMLLNVASAMAASRLALGLTVLATFLASLMANGALLRLAFADEHASDPEFRIGRQGFQFGRPETRLLGAMLLLLLFAFIAFLFMLLLAALFTVGLVFSNGQTTVSPAAAVQAQDVQLMLSLLVFIFFIVLFWVWIRVSLFASATISSKHVQVFSTWHLTNHNWWRVFSASLLLFLPTLVLEGFVQASQHYPALQASFAILTAAVNAFVEIPLSCGLYAYLYKHLRTAGAAASNAPLVSGTPSTGLAGPWG